MSYITSMLSNKTVLAIIELLKNQYPDSTPFLRFHNSFELLISVIMSAQTTDEQVNKVTPELFSRFPNLESLASATLAEVEQIIKSTGFYHSKAKNIIGTSQMLLTDFGGQVPGTMEELTTLPGVGRKTAGVILSVVFNKPAIIVDTHFGRVVRRLGFTDQKDPVKVEQDVAVIVPLDEQSRFSMTANRHGRAFCHARNPKCDMCLLNEICRYYQSAEKE